MTVIFKQIKNDKDISEKEGFGTMLVSSFVIACFLIFMINKLNLNPFFIAFIMISLALFSRLFTRKLLGDFAKKSDIIGALKFDSNSISWTIGDSNHILNCADISSINLKFNYIQGRQFTYRDIIHNGLAHMTIQTKFNQALEVKFLIETSKQLKALKLIWKEYYRQNIKISESMGKYEIKTILFDNLTFDKIQELKKELNVDSFY